MVRLIDFLPWPPAGTGPPPLLHRTLRETNWGRPSATTLGENIRIRREGRRGFPPTLDSSGLLCPVLVLEDAGPEKGGGCPEEEELAVDGTHVLGPVQLGLVRGEGGEEAAHDGDAGHGGGGEGEEVERSQGTGWVPHCLGDQEGGDGVERDGRDRHDGEGLPASDPVTQRGPANPP